jgi:hypothetical protein
MKFLILLINILFNSINWAQFKITSFSYCYTTRSNKLRLQTLQYLERQIGCTIRIFSNLFYTCSLEFLNESKSTDQPKW